MSYAEPEAAVAGRCPVSWHSPRESQRQAQPRRTGKTQTSRSSKCRSFEFDGAVYFPR